MKPVRIAIAGAGTIGQAHMDAARRSAHCVLSAIVDPAPGTAALAAMAGVPLCTNLQQFLTADTPDGVILATFPHLEPI